VINDIRFYLNQEQPLDAWLLETMAAINEAVYEIVCQLNIILDGVETDVS